MIKERPIPFSADMVNAILREENPKTMTRRKINIKSLPPGDYEIDYWQEEEPGLWLAISNDESGEFPSSFNPYLKCHYGKVGDKLWVREAWRITAMDSGLIKVQYRADGHCRQDWIAIDDELFARYLAQTKEDAKNSGLTPGKSGIYTWLPEDSPSRWRQARFMPKAIARIWLEIREVRAEALQDISEQEAKKEGVCREWVLDWAVKNMKEPNEYQYWMNRHFGGEDGTFCFKCGEKRRKQLIREHKLKHPEYEGMDSLDGGFHTMPDDIPAFCDSCRKPLKYSLTDYGADQEWDHFMENGFTKEDSYSLVNVLECRTDLEHFHKTCFRSLWEMINGQGSWAENPDVWAISFQRIEGGDHE